MPTSSGVVIIRANIDDMNLAIQDLDLFESIWYEKLTVTNIFVN